MDGMKDSSGVRPHRLAIDRGRESWRRFGTWWMWCARTQNQSQILPWCALHRKQQQEAVCDCCSSAIGWSRVAHEGACVWYEPRAKPKANQTQSKIDGGARRSACIRVFVYQSSLASRKSKASLEEGAAHTSRRSIHPAEAGHRPQGFPILIVLQTHIRHTTTKHVQAIQWKSNRSRDRRERPWDETAAAVLLADGVLHLFFFTGVCMCSQQPVDLPTHAPI